MGFILYSCKFFKFCVMFWVNVRWLSPSAIQDRMSYSHTLWFILVLLDDVKMCSNTGLDNTAGTIKPPPLPPPINSILNRLLNSCQNTASLFNHKAALRQTPLLNTDVNLYNLHWACFLLVISFRQEHVNLDQTGSNYYYIWHLLSVS